MTIAVVAFLLALLHEISLLRGISVVGFRGFYFHEQGTVMDRVKQFNHICDTKSRPTHYLVD